VFLRDSIRSDFMREHSRSDLTASRSDLVASGELRRDAASASASEFEYLQKEMVVLRDRLVEQQALFKQEESSRYGEDVRETRVAEREREREGGRERGREREREREKRREMKRREMKRREMKRREMKRREMKRREMKRGE
jgi:hypothetical protein